MMVIRVADDRVYQFGANSTIIVEVYDNYAEVLVLPERRRFLVNSETPLRIWHEYADAPTSKEVLVRYVSYSLRSKYMLVDEEVLS